MLPIKWKLEALEDLAEIINYIELRNPTAAASLHRTIVRITENLSSAPYLFVTGRDPGTRECVVHPNYLVVYQVGADSIDVLRVLHARQQYP